MDKALGYIYLAMAALFVLGLLLERTGKWLKRWARNAERREARRLHAARRTGSRRVTR